MFFGRGSRVISKIQFGLISRKDGDGDGDGSGDKWYSSLPEDMHSWDEVTNSDSPEKFYDQVKNMRSFLGSSIRIPGKDAGDEDWKSFHDKLKEKVPTLMPAPDLEDPASMEAVYDSLGRPAKAEDYTIPEFSDIKDWDDTPAKELQGLAHKAGLSNKQYNELVKGMTQSDNELRVNAQAANKEAHEALAKEWGADYKRRMETAVNITKLTDAPKEFQDLLASSDATPETYRWLHSLATKFKGEGANLLHDVNDQKVALTPNEAANKIVEIRNNKKHPYWDKTAPGHDAALKTMNELYELKLAQG